MFVRYAEIANEEKSIVLDIREIEYYCHIIPFTMAAVYNQRFPENGNPFFEYQKNPVCLKQIRFKTPRHIIFSGETVEELAKSADFFGLPFDKNKVCI